MVTGMGIIQNLYYEQHIQSCRSKFWKNLERKAQHAVTINDLTASPCLHHLFSFNLLDCQAWVAHVNKGQVLVQADALCLAW